MKKALITGIFGQDGSYLCELLNSLGYEVHGLARNELSINSKLIKDELDKEHCNYIIHNINLYDFESVKNLIKQLQPDEIYHMAAYHVSSEGKGNGEFLREQLLFNNNVLATANLLESCALEQSSCHIVTAGSCLMFDDSNTVCQNEETPFKSSSLYGLAKISEQSLVNYYRNKGLYACTAILYNHESHRRASTFVTKKIAENMLKIKNGEIDSFSLGDINILKDWGYAKDYAYGMYLMQQKNIATDYILATGKLHTIADLINKTAEIIGLQNWERFIKYNESVITRKINGLLKGDASKIKLDLGWQPTISFDDLVREITYGN